MEFEAVRKETVMLNPQKEMAERRIPSEIRIDPLTGRTARICHFMELQWEKPDFEAMVAGTDEDLLPYMEQEIPAGPTRGNKISRTDFKAARQHYYSIWGWDDTDRP